MRPFSWKSVTIYLSIILFLLLVIQFGDRNKRGEKETQYLDEIEGALQDVIDFQTLIIDGDVQVDTNKQVLEMSEKTFQYQLSFFIDVFGNLSEADVSLYDYYEKIDQLLTAFYNATSVDEQREINTQLQQQYTALQQFIETL